MTENLDKIDPVEKTDIGPAMLQLAGQSGRRGIIIIISDFFVKLDDLEDALQRLRYDRHEVVLMQVLHPDELNFDLEGMVRFVGIEDEDIFLTRPNDIRQAYLAALNRFNDELEDICDRNRTERLLCDTSRPMAELFADYLQQRTVTRRRF